MKRATMAIDVVSAVATTIPGRKSCAFSISVRACRPVMQENEAFDQLDHQVPEEDALQPRRGGISSGPFQLT